ncbi:MAG: response regulator transcription factor [Ferruginibacter sp.]
MKDKIRIAIVDDHQIVIDGLHSLLSNDPSIEIACSSTSAQEIFQMLQKNKVDILLTDIMMEPMNGVTLAKKVHEEYPLIKVLALSMSGAGDMVDEMIRNDSIQGYVLKNIGKQELLQAIQKIANGGIYYSDEVLISLEKENDRQKQSDHIKFTAREIEIIRLIERENNNKQIAGELFISERTVETHRKNIFRKLDSNSVIGLIKYAYEHKLI